VLIPKFWPIFLFVSHYAADGTLVEAPPADMGSMTECIIAKKEMERGFRVDAVERYEVECLKGLKAFERMNREP